jgi:hypothetical protein
MNLDLITSALDIVYRFFLLNLDPDPGKILWSKLVNFAVNFKNKKLFYISSWTSMKGLQAPREASSPHGAGSTTWLKAVFRARILSDQINGSVARFD